MFFFYLSESDSRPSVFPIDCEKEFSPQEKLKYLKRVSVQYWNHLCKQMIKLKQLSKIDNDVSIMDDSRNFSINTTMDNSRASFSPSTANRRAYQAKFYFDYSETGKTSRDLDGYDLCEDEVNVEKDMPEDAEYQEQGIIHIGLLNLILDCLEQADEDVDQESVSVRLKEALSLFNMMATNLDEKLLVDLDHRTLQVIAYQSIKVFKRVI